MNHNVLFTEYYLSEMESRMLAKGKLELKKMKVIDGETLGKEKFTGIPEYTLTIFGSDLLIGTWGETGRPHF